MAFGWTEAIGLAGPMLAGVAQSLGQNSANQTNARIAGDQMNFQERMSSTAHQREVEDMKKAGLNPMLGSMNGASTPTGASATMENTMGGFASTAQDMSNTIQRSREYALAKEKQGKELEVMNTQMRNMNANTAKAAQETRALQYDADSSKLKSDSIRAIRPYLDKLLDRTSSTAKDAAGISKQPSYKLQKAVDDMQNRQWSKRLAPQR